MDSAIALNAGCVPNLGSDGGSSDNRTFFAGLPILEWGMRLLFLLGDDSAGIFLARRTRLVPLPRGFSRQEFPSAPQINREPTVANEATS
jgi:hypothetical protein